MVAVVMINYRREDAGHAAGRLRDLLAERFGDENVFLDVESIQPGERFAEEIESTLDKASVVLVLIGPTWLSVSTAGDEPRINDEGDWVRMEIAAALKSRIRIIPVLLDGTKMPPRSGLPDDIKELTGLQASGISQARFRRDVADLGDLIEPREVASPQASTRPEGRAPATTSATPGSRSEAAPRRTLNEASVGEDQSQPRDERIQTPPWRPEQLRKWPASHRSFVAIGVATIVVAAVILPFVPWDDDDDDGGSGGGLLPSRTAVTQTPEPTASRTATAQKVAVPNVYGSNPAEAIAQLSGLGFVVQMLSCAVRNLQTRYAK